MSELQSLSPWLDEAPALCPALYQEARDWGSVRWGVCFCWRDKALLRAETTSCVPLSPQSQAQGLVGWWVLGSFIHPFIIQQVLSTCYVPGTVLCTENMGMNKTDKSPCPFGKQWNIFSTWKRWESELCGCQGPQLVQRPWGWTVPGMLEKQGQGLYDWREGGKEGERGREGGGWERALVNSYPGVGVWAHFWTGFVETISVTRVESMRCPKSAVTMRNEELLLRYVAAAFVLMCAFLVSRAGWDNHHGLKQVAPWS